VKELETQFVSLYLNNGTINFGYLIKLKDGFFQLRKLDNEIEYINKRYVVKIKKGALSKEVPSPQKPVNIPIKPNLSVPQPPKEDFKLDDNGFAIDKNGKVIGLNDKFMGGVQSEFSLGGGTPYENPIFSMGGSDDITEEDRGDEEQNS
jgi:hypothetical protein